MEEDKKLLEGRYLVIKEFNTEAANKDMPVGTVIELVHRSTGLLDTINGRWQFNRKSLKYLRRLDD